MLTELRAARKLTHWMWFVFPQLAVLGFSMTHKREVFFSTAGGQGSESGSTASDVHNVHMSDHSAIAAVRLGTLLSGQHDALEMALRGAPLHDILDVLVRTAETQSDGNFLGSILLLDEDGQHLRHGAAPSLPAAYNEAIDGIEIGPKVGSCGTAAHFGHAIVVTDIGTDPLWADFRDLALAHGLKACWSTPFQGSDGRVLGTLALYYLQPRGPSQNDRDTVERIARTAALVVEHSRWAAASRRGEGPASA